ncbi:MAG: hypothetical protein JRJ65_14795 [Deltaproteobacteria bacterium]|nr:hypothetical protein [Deltaproteobacteria bacterium]
MLGKERTICKYLQARQIIPFALALALCLISVSPALAHKVYLFAWVEGDTVYTDSYFPGKKKVINGPIKVFDPSGKQLLEGKTDEKGRFFFKIPQRTDLRIVLEATMGHRAEYILKAEEVSDIAVIPDAEKETDRLQDSSPGAVRVDMEQIRIMVEKAIDDRLKPIVRMLARIQEERGPGLTEIIGGIGYIFGLMGIVLYFKSRKKD